MTQQLRFDSHAAFHQQVLRVTVAAAAFGLVAYVVRLVLSSTSDAMAVTGAAILAAVLGLAANPWQPGRRLMTGAFALGVGLVGSLCMFGLATAPRAYPWFGVMVFGAAIGLIAGRDLKDVRRFAVPLATALSVALAMWVKGVFEARLLLTDYVPTFIAEPAYAAAFGFLVSIGLLARQVRIERDRVSQAYDQIKGALSGEMADLCERAMTTYRRIVDALRDNGGDSAEPKLVKGVQNLLLKIVSLGRRWQEVERDASRTSASDLTERLSELDRKIAEATDAVARRQYEVARDALQAQLGYLRDISRSRERVLARVHAYLAALERVHLGVVNHQGADTAKFSDELQPILDDLDDMGAEIDIASEAITEASEIVVRARAEAPETAERSIDEAEADTDDPDPAADADTDTDASLDPEAALYRSAHRDGN